MKRKRFPGEDVRHFLQPLFPYRRDGVPSRDKGRPHEGMAGFIVGPWKKGGSFPVPGDPSLKIRKPKKSNA